MPSSSFLSLSPSQEISPEPEFISRDPVSILPNAIDSILEAPIFINSWADWLIHLFVYSPVLIEHLW